VYTIQHLKDLNILEIKNPDASVYGKLYLDLGASLQELTLNRHNIIQDLSPLDYATTYASSILFPFANRIKDGIYEFKGKTFQFEKNHTDEANALHGLVFNKTFDIVSQHTSADNASVTLQYIENSISKGFPYTYKVTLNYKFTKASLSLKMSVENTDVKPFPFTVGWHPYFSSANLFDSELVMDKVVFKTPNYNLQFNATGNTNFIQAYTPPKANTIAIEPTTGVSDSFNNNIGLQVLKPNDTYSITWSLKLDNN